MISNELITKSVFYELAWPKKIETQQVESFLAALNNAAACKDLTFITVATQKKISHYIAVNSKEQKSLLNLFDTFLPTIEAVPCYFPKLKNPLLYANAYFTNNDHGLCAKDSETLSFGILNSLQNLLPGEYITISWKLGPRRAPHITNNRSIGLQSTTWTGAFIEALISPNKSKNNLTLRDRLKAESPAWKTLLEIAVYSPVTTRKAILVNRVTSALKGAEAPGIRLRVAIHLKRSGGFKKFSLLTAHELTALIGWPLGDKSVNGVERYQNHRIAPSVVVEDGKVVANSTAPKCNAKIRMQPNDAMLHTHILGPTGVGKSTLLLNLICQDMHSNAGIIVIDPKGDLIDEILLRVPESRKNDVVVFDPSDESRPVGLNPLVSHEIHPSLLVDDILHIFRDLYGNSFGPRTQDIVHAGLLTLANATEANLCALPLLYTNPVFRYRFIQSLDDPIGLGSFWDWFETISDSERNHALAPVMNKLRAFLLRPAMRRVIGQTHPKFSIEEVLTKQKILLVNLAKGKVGTETAQLFGSLIVSQFWQIVQHKPNKIAEGTTNTYMYIDEVQDYLHLPTSIDDMLAQMRSFKVGMTLAHQHLNQLPGDLRSGVLANARNRICFQLNHHDATIMARGDTNLCADDFEHLPKHHVYAKLAINGEVTPWASGKTIAPPPTQQKIQEITKLSRERYGKDIIEIEKELGELIKGKALFPNQAKIGKRKIGANA